MKFDEILDLIKDLSRSQGFYGRLYASLQELKDEDPAGYNSLRK